MGYQSMGDIASTEFNSTKYPGICKPSTVTALAVFKRLQSQLNRVAKMKGYGLISVDGDIGPGTMSLFAKVQSEVVAFATSYAAVADAMKLSLVSASSCSSLASAADIAGDACEGYATKLGAPSSVAGPAPAKASTLVLPNGAEVAPPVGADILTAWTNAPTAMKIAAVAVAGGIGYYLYKGAKKRRR